MSDWSTSLEHPQTKAPETVLEYFSGNFREKTAQTVVFWEKIFRVSQKFK
jgi:hypothetical protein